jgi:hypothetical protein
MGDDCGERATDGTLSHDGNKLYRYREVLSDLAGAGPLQVLPNTGF